MGTQTALKIRVALGSAPALKNSRPGSKCSVSGQVESQALKPTAHPLFHYSDF